MDDWQKDLRDAAQKQLDIIAANRELYLAAWFAETGLKPSESMLVEQRETSGTTITTTVRIVPMTEWRKAHPGLPTEHQEADEEPRRAE